jgi:protein-disulfide isomerase-like protein with CxxC motif
LAIDKDGKETGMTERVCFYFDPICPWCYQTSRWAERLEELGEIELEWGVFSLELQNAGKEPEELAEAHARSARALRTAVLVRDVAGQAAVGAFYKALGTRVHERGEPLQDEQTVEAALDDAGLDPGLSAKAWADDTTAEGVAAEHRQLCERTRSFGVPTIVLDAGNGPAIFGPVISEVPDDADAIELWRHVSWLVRHENFAELKRDRLAPPELESVRQWQRARARHDDGGERKAS